MSLFKYHRETKDDDGVPLWWPGGPDGFPYRGAQPPVTTKNEYDNLRLSGQFRCRTFYLAVDKDAEDYQKVRDRCANGWYVPVDRERSWDEATNNYRIYLEWVERSYTSGSNPTQGAIPDEYVKQPAGPVSPYSRLAGVGQDW